MNADQLHSILNRFIAPLKNRVLLMVGRAVLTAVKDSSGVQQVQVKALAEESLDDVERFQHFGFSSNPPVGSEAIFVCLGGNREGMVVIATENRQLRFKNLASGEMAIYTDDGTFLHLKKSGQVELKTSTKVLIDAPNVEVKGDLKVTGDTILQKKLNVGDDATLAKKLSVTQDASFSANVAVTGAVAAASFSGPSGGTMVAAADIQTTGNITGGGTDMASIKSTFNSHTHPENPPVNGGNTSAPNETL